MNGQTQRPQGKSTISWRTLLWVLIFWMAIAYLLQAPFRDDPRKVLSYTEFKAHVRRGAVSEITMTGDTIQGRMIPAENGKPSPDGRQAARPDNAASGESQFTDEDPETVVFQTVKPAIQEPGFIEFLERHGVEVNARTQERSWLWGVAIAVLPWLLIIGFFVYANRKFQQRLGGGQGGGPSALPNHGPNVSNLRRLRPPSTTWPVWRMPRKSCRRWWPI